MASNLYSLLTILGFPENTHMPVNSQAVILWNFLLNLEITEALQSHYIYISLKEFCSSLQTLNAPESHPPKKKKSTKKGSQVLSESQTFIDITFLEDG